jgi:hypothetical protein
MSNRELKLPLNLYEGQHGAISYGKYYLTKKQIKNVIAILEDKIKLIEENGFDIPKTNYELALQYKYEDWRQKPYEKTYYIYLAYNIDSNLWKIGITTNLSQRLNQLKKQYPTIDFKHSFLGNYYLEHYLHSKYEDKHVIGEWFSLTIEDVEDIVYNFKEQ